VALVVDHYAEDWTELGWVQIRGTARLLEPGEEGHSDGVAALRAKYDQYADHDLKSKTTKHAMQSVALTHTLSFGLTITTGEPSDLHDGCLEARRIRNETNRLDKHGECRLHVTVTHEHAEVADKHDADTSIGVDVNEDCIAVAAMSTDGHLEDSVVFEYTEVKTQRHEFKPVASVGR